MDDAVSTDVRELVPSDRAALEAFACTSFGQRFTRDTQATIREVLPDLIDTGDVNTLGLFVGDELCALIAWTVEGQRWNSAVCATANTRRRRHYASRLKKEMLASAQDADAISVTSTVHIRNDAMLDMNVKLGAVVTRDRSAPDYMLCTIRLR